AAPAKFGGPRAWYSERSGSGGKFELVLAHAASRYRGDPAAASVSLTKILVSLIVALERQMVQPRLAHRCSADLSRGIAFDHREPGGFHSQWPWPLAPARHFPERSGGPVVL